MILIGSGLEVVVLQTRALVLGREAAGHDLDLIDRLQRNDVEDRPVVPLLAQVVIGRPSR